MSFRYLIVTTRELKMINNGLFLIIFYFLFIPTLSIAGSFKVTPVTLNFGSGIKTTAFRINNYGDRRVTVQLDVMEWKQSETELDIYNQTKDIVFFPKIVTLEKEEERIIRVGYQKDDNIATEKSYRLFLEELPVVEPGNAILKFKLKVVMPIFISPLKVIKKPSLEKVQFSAGKLVVRVKNRGNKHFVVGKITASGLDSLDRQVFKTDSNGWYILAGATKTFYLNVPEVDCIKADKVTVKIEVDRTTMKEDFVLDQTQCVNPKEDGKIQRGPSSK